MISLNLNNYFGFLRAWILHGNSYFPFFAWSFLRRVLRSVARHEGTKRRVEILKVMLTTFIYPHITCTENVVYCFRIEHQSVICALRIISFLTDTWRSTSPTPQKDTWLSLIQILVTLQGSRSNLYVETVSRPQGQNMKCGYDMLP